MKLNITQLRQIISEVIENSVRPEGEEVLLQYGLDGLNYKYDILGLKNDPRMVKAYPQVIALFKTNSMKDIHQIISLLEILEPELLEKYNTQKNFDHKNSSNMNSNMGMPEIPPDIPGWDKG
tara:strand:- start:423 stop:788 length:366 start_codon:yes stop_codon:yes gene_type:complete